MKPAGDAGARDVIEQVPVGAHPVGPEPFPHVAVEIDGRAHWTLLPPGARYGTGFIAIRFLPAGPDALVVELDDQDAVNALHAEIARRRADGWLPSLLDVVPGARTILLDGVDDPAGAAAQIRSWPVAAVPVDVGPVVEVPCVYDGADLALVAARWAVPEADVAGLHASILHRVAFCGFAPGFAYLTGIGEERAVPRRPSPRTTVPGGSVAVAGEYTGIYPRPSPGGWNLIGRTDLVLWDAGRPTPALLGPGTLVRFVAIGDSRG